MTTPENQPSNIPAKKASTSSMLLGCGALMMMMIFGLGLCGTCLNAIRGSSSGGGSEKNYGSSRSSSCSGYRSCYRACARPERGLGNIGICGEQCAEPNGFRDLVEAVERCR